MYASIVAAILHVPVCFLFVYTFDMGVVGLAWATTVKEAVLLFGVVAYCMLSSKISSVL